MRKLVSEKNRAIEMRKKGKTYNEIRNELGVAKSSLSLWLKDLPFTEEEKHFIRRNVRARINKGRVAAALSNHKRRLARDEITRVAASASYERYIHQPLFQVGLALYWAEGSKRNKTFQFVNSDEKIVETALIWVHKYLDIERSKIRFRLYIHKPYAHEGCEEWWQGVLGISKKQMRQTVYKPTTRLVKKRPKYKGCLRIEINNVAVFRTVLFWLERFKNHYK